MNPDTPYRFQTDLATEDEKLLRGALKQRQVALGELVAKCQHWRHEDRIYKFYSGSFKVFYFQELTEEIVNELRGLLPGREMDPQFLQIISEGTGKVFDLSCNADWLKRTRPILEAFFHARFMLEMAARHAYLDVTPTGIPALDNLPGWRALLYLFHLRG